MPPRRPGRARRALVAVGKAAGLGVVFALATLVGAVLHLRLPASRRLATTGVNRLLETKFRGRLTIERVGGLGLTWIDGVDASVLDPEGRPVLAIHGVRARLATLTLLRSLLRGDRLLVRLPWLAVDAAEVALEQDPSGRTGLQRAFEPREPALTAAGGGAEVAIAEIHVGHASVHGRLAAAPSLDAELDDFGGALASTPSTTAMDVARLHASVRGLAGMNAEGSVEAHASLPAGEGEMQVSGRYDGRVGDIPVRAEGSLDGRHVVALVDVPRTEPGAFNALAPGRIRLGAPVSAHAEVRGELPVLRPELRARVGDGAITASGTVTLPERPGAELAASAKLNARDLDLGLLHEGAPRSRLTVSVEASVVSRPGGALAGSYHVENEVGELSGRTIPAATVRGELTERSVRGRAQIAERGAPTTVTFSLAPRGGAASPNELAFDAETTVPDLNAIPRVGPIGRGHAHLRVVGHLDLDTKRASARASGELGGVAVRGVRLASGFVTANVEGPFASPRFAAEVRGSGLQAGGYGFTGMRVSASGSTDELDVAATLDGEERSPTVTARGHVKRAAGASVRAARVELEIRDLSVRGAPGATVRVAASLDRTHLRGEARLALGDAGHLEISAPDVEIGGSATELSAWKTATGTVAITGDVNLDRLLAALPEASRPVAVAGGTIAVHAEASRPSRASSLTVELAVATTGLRLVAKQATQTTAGGAPSLGPAPWHTEGLDGTFGVKVDGRSGLVQTSAKLHDDHGPLASVEASAHLPLGEIWEHPEALLAVARDAPVNARVAVPRRSLDAMPPALGRLPVTGDVELAGELTGTARTPKLTLNAKGTHLLARGATTCVSPVNVEANTAYDGETVDLHLAASRDGRAVLGSDATVKVSATRAMAGGAVPWEASGDATLMSFPLDAAGAFVAQPIAGTLSGKVSIKDLHRAASLEADLDVRALSFDHAAFPHGRVHVQVKDEAIDASARLDQSDGYAETRASGAIAWGAALMPSMDPARPIDAAVLAKNFRADALMPLVQGIFTELDGRIDADARLHVESGGKAGHLDGGLVFHDGSFEVPQIGERFHGLRGRVIMKPWGTIRFDDVSAEGPTGKLSANARAVLEGLSLRSASAEVQIAKGKSLPIDIQGVAMGRAYGKLTADAVMSPDGRRLDVTLDIPSLHVELPQSTAHAVQPLDPDKPVRIGVHHHGELVAIPLAAPEKPRAPTALAVHAVVRLGSDVEVTRGTTVDAAVEGETTIDVGGTTRVGGRIRVTRGKLELEGKQFILDHGVVSFVGDDPSNPMVVAAAHWDAPDGKTRVFADFSGYASSGKLALRSEPALSQDEIISLILFGSPDGTFGAQASSGQQASAGVQAAGLAGSVVTEGLNKAISGITTVDVTTRIGTSESGNPLPEVAIQLSKKISASVAYKVGVPTPGENPDRTELTLDWRFIRNWSLVTTVGDQGSTALDVIWRKRY